MTWYAIQSDEESIKGIQDSFSLLYYYAGLPPKMCLAVDRSSSPLKLYLSPECIPVAKGIVECFGGFPVSEPAIEDLEWLVGCPSALI